MISDDSCKPYVRKHHSLVFLHDIQGADAVHLTDLF